MNLVIDVKHVPQHREQLFADTTNHFAVYERIGRGIFYPQLDATSLANKLRIAADKTFQIVNEDLLNPLGLPITSAKTFDIILALNIFHHYVKTKNDLERLENWLRELSGRFRVMFFESHNPIEKQMTNAYRNYTGDEFAAFILAHVGLSTANCIYVTGDNRKLYKIS